MQRSALCRSRRELSNAYLLAKIGVDTAENEPCKVCPLSVYRSPRSPEYKPVVRDEASPPRSQASFQEAEEKTVEKATPRKKEEARGEETAVDDDDDRPN